MSRRSDYVLAVSVALQKDTTIVSYDALRVLERVAELPEERFPPLKANDVRQFVRHALGEAEAPAWVLEAAEAGDVSVEDLVDVEAVEGGASELWHRNAVTLVDTLSDDLMPFLATGRGRMARSDWERLQQWVASIPGEREVECPWVVVEREEDHGDEG